LSKGSIGTLDHIKRIDYIEDSGTQGSELLPLSLDLLLEFGLCLIVIR